MERIESFRIELTPNEDGHVFLIFDTVFGSKHVFTALGIGRVRRDDIELTPTAQATINTLAGHGTAHGSGTLRCWEVATSAAVPVRLRKALESANDKDAVFFVVRGPDVYDALFAALQVNFSAPATAQ